MRRLHQDAVEGQGRPRRRERPHRPAAEVEQRAQGPGAGEPLVEVRQDDQRDSRARGAEGVAQEPHLAPALVPEEAEVGGDDAERLAIDLDIGVDRPARLATTDLEVDEADGARRLRAEDRVAVVRVQPVQEGPMDRMQPHERGQVRELGRTDLLEADDVRVQLAEDGAYPLDVLPAVEARRTRARCTRRRSRGGSVPQGR
jgi:hypothetical protein